MKKSFMQQFFEQAVERLEAYVASVEYTFGRWLTGMARTISPRPLARRDLLTGRMPQQEAPVQRVTRPERDQRPLLRRFTVKRVDFAF